MLCMKKIRLKLRTLPISTNQLHGVFHGRKILSKKGRENKEAMAWEARTQYHGLPVVCPVSLKIGLCWPTKRNHDIDNGLKSLLDAMTGILWEDDSQIVELTIYKGYSKENPRVDLLITPL